MDHQVFSCKKLKNFTGFIFFNAYCIIVFTNTHFSLCLSYHLVYLSIHPSIQGGKEFLMRAHFGLPSVENDEAEGKPPITVKFEIPYFTVSGIQVCVRLLVHKYWSVFMQRLLFLVK